MRDLAVLLTLGILLGLALAGWAWLLAPAEWHWDGIHRHAYWPFTVEIAVRDR